MLDVDMNIIELDNDNACRSAGEEEVHRLFDDEFELLYPYDLDEHSINDEAKRLLKEIQIGIQQVQKSKFYSKLTKKIKGDAFQRRLKRVLGESNTFLDLVIYALGSLEFGFNPIFQLAIALLLKQDFSSWIGKIEVFDPIFSPADIVVLKELGCEVLLVNEKCRRQVEKPTLFYMPHADYKLTGDLLWANWCPSRINQLIILDVSFESARTSLEYFYEKFNGTSYDYIHAIKNHTKEIKIKRGYGGKYDGIFYNFAFHFFEVDSQFNMDTLIPDEDGKLLQKRLQGERELDEISMSGQPNDFLWQHRCSEEVYMRPFVKDLSKMDWSEYFGEYRGSRRFRCSWNPPPEGWIKLNFGGTSSKNGKNFASFGGICQNESKQPILIYKGVLGKVDKTIASIEALRFGLTELLKIPNVTRNLIVEGDDFMVIQWANKRKIEHPKEIDESLTRVLSLLEEFNSVIYHVYEEANLVANKLARRAVSNKYC